MTTTIDQSGETEPAPARVTVEKRDGVWMAQPVDVVPVLTNEAVERTIEDLRGRRPLAPVALAPAER